MELGGSKGHLVSSTLPLLWPDSIPGIDPAKVVIAGDSSGGSLAAATCIMHRDIQSEQFPPIKAQVPIIYPKY